MATRWLRVAWPAALLLVFFAGLRNLSERARPAVPTADCDHISRDDVVALEQCVALRPREVELLTDAGAAYARAERWDRAEDAYRRALTIDPQDGDVRVRLGDVLLRRGDADGARREGHTALALQPGREAAADLVRRADGGGR